MSKNLMPQCIGDYAPTDAVCNGDPSGATEYDRATCVWRDKCLAFQVHLAETGKEADVHLGFERVTEGGVSLLKAVPKSPGELDGIIKKNLKRYGIKDGKITRAPAPEGKKDKRRFHKPTKRHKVKAAKAQANMYKDRRRDLADVFNKFKTDLASHLPRHRFPKASHAMVPGDLYVKRSKNYITLCCRTRRGRDIGLARIWYKTRNIGLDVELPVDVPSFQNGVGKMTFARLSPKAFVDGAFQSRMYNLDVEGLSLAAEAIGMLVKKGKIVLPEV